MILKIDYIKFKKKKKGCVIESWIRLKMNYWEWKKIKINISIILVKVVIENFWFF